MLIKIFKRVINRIISDCNSKINSPEKARALGVKVGNNCRFSNISFSSEPYLVSIGDHVSATDVHFETHDGGVWIFRDRHPDWDVIKKISIGNNVYLGKNVLILPGVNVFDNVIVGAGSVVTKDLPSGYVYGGIPAKRIKTIEEYYDGIVLSHVKTKNFTAEEKEKYFLNLNRIE